MRLLVFVFIIIGTATVYGQAEKNLKKVEWLNGTWHRVNAKPGRSGYEVWKAGGPTTMVGFGIAMKGTDTTFVEKIRMELKDGKIFYVADVPENKGEVWFEITELKEKSFVCENPKHDFPKKIAYTLDGKNLKATISGDGKEIDYLFTKQ